MNKGHSSSLMFSVASMIISVVAIVLAMRHAPSESATRSGFANYSRAEVVNDAGVKVGSFTLMGSEPALVLRDEKGRNKMWLAVHEGNPQIIMFADNGDQTILDYASLTKLVGPQR